MPDYQITIDPAQPDPTYPPAPGSERMVFAHARVVLDARPTPARMAVPLGTVVAQGLHVQPLEPPKPAEVTAEAFSAAAVALARDNAGHTWEHESPEIAEHLARVQLLALLAALGVPVAAQALTPLPGKAELLALLADEGGQR